MKDLIIQKNKLRNDAMRLREIKFDDRLKDKKTLELNIEQNKLWHKYEFYGNMIKAINKSEVKK